MDGTHGYAAIIGDISGSRFTRDRRRLQNLLMGTLMVTDRRIPPALPLTPTVGDEFQGIYRTVQEALEATFWIRLLLIGEIDVRFGIGWGKLTLFVPNEAGEPLAQDGPAWWAARTALERATSESRRPQGSKGLRTWFVTFERMAKEASAAQRDRYEELDLIDVSESLGPPGVLKADVEDLVNAYLLCRDQLVKGIGPNEVESLVDFMSNTSQRRIAEKAGVSQSAISQRLIRNGAYALRTAQEQIKRALR